MRASSRQSCRLGAAQDVAIGAASAASAAFGTQTYQVRVVATSACRVRIGEGTPTALATDSYLPADRPEYLTCTPGQKIAVIQESAGGKLSITEVA
jgi:hypothetical protein